MKTPLRTREDQLKSGAYALWRSLPYKNKQTKWITRMKLMIRAMVMIMSMIIVMVKVVMDGDGDEDGDGNGDDQ